MSSRAPGDTGFPDQDAPPRRAHCVSASSGSWANCRAQALRRQPHEGGKHRRRSVRCFDAARSCSIDVAVAVVRGRPDRRVARGRAVRTGSRRSYCRCPPVKSAARRERTSPALRRAQCRLPTRFPPARRGMQPCVGEHGQLDLSATRAARPRRPHRCGAGRRAPGAAALALRVVPLDADRHGGDVAGQSAAGGRVGPMRRCSGVCI
jgi:hypothetical protein